MQEQLQSKLVEILTSIQTAAGKASDFAIEQLPDVAQSYIAYGRVWHLFMFVLFLSITAGMVWAIRWAVANDKVDETDGAAVIFPGILGAVTGVTTLVQANAALLAWCAPKVWLLKELASLVK